MKNLENRIAALEGHRLTAETIVRCEDGAVMPLDRFLKERPGETVEHFEEYGPDAVGDVGRYLEAIRASCMEETTEGPEEVGEIQE